jgi:cytochrome P450
MTGDYASMEDIIDDFFVFMVAGMETTAITMSILIWLLLKHPDISQKVVEEVKSLSKKGVKEVFVLPWFSKNCPRFPLLISNY